MRVTAALRCRFDYWCRFGRGCLFPILSIEAFHTSGRVNELLFSGVVRMAGRANFDVDIADGRAGFKSAAANTGDDGLFIVRVNGFFH